MIRRDFLDAERLGWLLIEQQEHARIAADLFAALPPRTDEDATVFDAILRHDDGWQSWDALPSFDVDAGRPYDFRETPRTDQDAIWSRSVELARDLGPLAQYMIAAHFLQLRAASKSQPTPPGGRAHESQPDFAAAYAAQAERWREQWVRQSPANRSLDRAAGHLAMLKWLDNVSLWLCCADRTETWSTDDHAGNPIIFQLSRPQQLATTTTSGEASCQVHDQPIEILVNPWPFATKRITVVAAAKCLPNKRYPSLESVRKTMTRGTTLSWCLRPNQ